MLCNRLTLVLGLLTLSACDVVFGLHRDGPTVRASYFVTGAGTSLSIPRELAIEDGDLVLVAIQGKADATALTARPLDWVLFVDTKANCAGQFHAWFMSGTVAGESSFDFTFNGPDNYVAIVTAYGNVGEATPQRSKTLDGSTPHVETLPAVDVRAGSLAWLGTAGILPFAMDPTNVSPQLAIMNLVVFEPKVEQNQVPEIEIQVPTPFCTEVAEVIIER